MNLEEHLAVNVMGWKVSMRFDNDVEWYDKINPPKHKQRWLLKARWNPPNNIEQAMECLNSGGDWSIDREGDNYFVYVAPYETHDGISYRATAQNKSLPMAISLACARASGWKDD